MDRKTSHATNLRTTSFRTNAAAVAAAAAAAAVVAADGECTKNKQIGPHRNLFAHLQSCLAFRILEVLQRVLAIVVL